MVPIRATRCTQQPRTAATRLGTSPLIQFPANLLLNRCVGAVDGAYVCYDFSMRMICCALVSRFSANLFISFFVDILSSCRVRFRLLNVPFSPHLSLRSALTPCPCPWSPMQFADAPVFTAPSLSSLPTPYVSRSLSILLRCIGFDNYLTGSSSFDETIPYHGRSLHFRRC